jgi:hypothetical protein
VTYAALMVHLEPGRSNTGLLKIAGNLAVRLQADVIGITACQHMQIIQGDGHIPAALLEADRNEIEKEIADAETEFRDVLGAKVRSLEWRSRASFESLSDYLAEEMRCADIVITRPASGDLLDG